MIDFHSHILPGIDDGSKTLDQTLTMLKIMRSHGVLTVAATPHFYANEQSVDEFIEKRNKAYTLVEQNAPDGIPRILLGAEVLFYNGISRLKGIEKLTLQGSRFLLLEMPFRRWTDYEINEIYDISNRAGIVVVLAHIERYLKYQKPAVLQALINSGVLIQCNASFFTAGITSFKAFKMLKNNQIHFIGSDCHNLTTRPPDMNAALGAIAKKLGDGFLKDFVYYGNELFLDNTIS